MSDVPLSRAANTDSAAWNTMKGVVFVRLANATTARWIDAETANRWVAPRPDATAGRGRSAGRSSWSGAPASRSRQ
ncbi:hypothetical protein RE9427_36510 [Prescottella equi]|nr:hypothetical protein RE9427_36510 [Prescottella equi]